MSDIVPVLFVKLVIRHVRERASPEHERLFNRQSDLLRVQTPNRQYSPVRSLKRSHRRSETHLEEKVVLQTTIMSQVLVVLQRVVQVSHTHRRMSFHQRVDHICRDVRPVLARERARVFAAHASEEAEREVGKHRKEPVVLVESWQRACCGLR